jgi:hypothetical protein
MVERCHQLRKVPLSDLTPGDCRLLIGQDVGTRHLVPLALSFLEGEPLVEGDYYPGDLLLALIQMPDTYWSPEESSLSSDVKLLKELNAFIEQNDA